MIKRLVLLVVILLNMGLIMGYSYSDNFQNCSSWIPQYQTRVFCNNNSMTLDSLSEYIGDPEVHASLNKTEIINFTNLITEINYSITSCNESFRPEKGYSPAGLAVYLSFFDEDNFISIEYKINANETYCGSGLAQISLFKRVNGISENLTRYTTYNFTINQNYSTTISIQKTDSIWNLNTTLGNLTLNASFEYNKVGEFLLESTGTLTKITSFYLITNLSNNSQTETPSNPINQQRSGGGSSKKTIQNLTQNYSINQTINNTKDLAESVINLSNNSEKETNKNLEQNSNSKENIKTSSITGNVIRAITNEYVIPIYVILAMLIIGFAIARSLEKNSWKVPNE